MSLPLKAIDRLFERLYATYGNDWVTRWAGLEEPKVKTVWAHELASYANHLEDIAWALENLPPRAPNVIEFRNLCRSAPRQAAPALPEPKADPTRLKAELTKLAEVRKTATGQVDHKAWAKCIIAAHEAGDRVRPISLRFAREALRMNVTGGA